MKKENIRKILVSVIALIMVTCLFAACNSDNGETTAAPTEPEAIEYTLYFNGDRFALGGSRVMNETFEVWYMDLCGKGRESTFRVATQELADALDQHDVFALETDPKTQIVTGFKTVEQLGAKYVADRAFVTAVDGNKITLSNMMNGTTDTFTIELNDETLVYDISGHVARCSVVELAEGDCIIAVANNLDEVTHVFIASSVTPTRMQYCPCAACREAELEETEFVAFTNNMRLPTKTGHWYLIQDHACPQQSIAANAKVVLDLNGYTVNGAPEARVYSLHNKGCTLDLLDSSEGETGAIVASGDGLVNAQGGCVWMRYGTFTLHSGTLDASKSTNRMNGCAIEISGDAFYMYGGTIKGGTAKSNLSSSGSMQGSYGGAIHCNANKIVEIHAGTIYGGKAEALVAGEEDGRSKGGLMFVGNGTTLKVWKEAKLIGGSADGGDGNMLWINTTGNIWFEDIEASLVYDGEGEAIGWNPDNVNNPAHPDYVDPNAPTEDTTATTGPAA